MNKNSWKIEVNFTLFFIIAAIFILLKLTNVINWSWTIVFAPIWLPILTTIALVIVVCIMRMIFKDDLGRNRK